MEVLYDLEVGRLFCSPTSSLNITAILNHIPTKKGVKCSPLTEEYNPDKKKEGHSRKYCGVTR